MNGNEPLIKVKESKIKILSGSLIQGKDTFNILPDSPILNPSARASSVLIDASLADADEFRWGVHYIRIPYATRPLLHDLYLRFYTEFAALNEPNDVSMIDREKDKYVIRNVIMPNAIPADPVNQAKAYVHLIMHAYYEIHFLIAKAALAVVKGRIVQGSGANSFNSTLRQSAIAGLMSQIEDMPINTNYLNSIINNLAILTTSSRDHGTTIVLPDLLPLGQAYYEDVMCKEGDYIHESASLPPLINEWEKFSSRRFINAASSESTLAHWGARKSTPLSKSQGTFVDHFIDELDFYREIVMDHYMRNQTVPKANIFERSNTIRPFLEARGYFDGVYTSSLLHDLANKIFDNQLDLVDYARKNWNVLNSPAPLIDTRDVSGVVHDFTDAAHLAADTTVLADTDTDVLDISLLYPFQDFCANHFDEDDLTYLKARMNSLGVLSNAYEAPYAYISTPPGQTIESMKLGLTGVFNARVPASWGTIASGTHELNDVYAQLVARKFGLRSNDSEYVDDVEKGRLQNQLSSNTNIFQYTSVFNSGCYMPMYKVTPLIDPYDRLMHGYFGLINLRDLAANRFYPSSYSAIIRGWLTNRWTAPSGLLVEAAQYTNAEAVALFSGSGGTITAAALQTELTLGTTGQINAFALSTILSAKVGFSLMFMGDCYNIPPGIQTTRLDVSFLLHAGYPMNTVNPTQWYENMNLIPVSPVRQRFIDLSMLSLVNFEEVAAAYDRSLLSSVTWNSDVEIPVLSSFTFGAVKRTSGRLNFPLPLRVIYLPETNPGIYKTTREFTDYSRYRGLSESRPQIGFNDFLSIPDQSSAAPGEPSNAVRKKERRDDRGKRPWNNRDKRNFKSNKFKSKSSFKEDSKSEIDKIDKITETTAPKNLTKGIRKDPKNGKKDDLVPAISVKNKE